MLVNADILSLGKIVTLHKGNNVVRLKIEKLHLSKGSYVVGLWLSRDGTEEAENLLDYMESALELKVVDAGPQAQEMNFDGPVACQFALMENS
jgi:hypothetical protein